MDNMLLGGLYDHVGGGFFRYTADERWLVPHFEKMLADNALMIEFLTSVWQFNRNGLCRQRDRGNRGLAAARDEAGRRLRRRPGSGVRRRGRKILSLDRGGDRRRPGRHLLAPALQGRSMASPATAITWARNILRRLGHIQPQPHRGRRGAAGQAARHAAGRARQAHAPARDDKLLADWNGLAISRPGPCRRGVRASRMDRQPPSPPSTRSCKVLGDGDRLYHSWPMAASAAPQGFADDYAHDGARRAAALGSHRRKALPGRGQALGGDSGHAFLGRWSRAAITPPPTMPNR